MFAIFMNGQMINGTKFENKWDAETKFLHVIDDAINTDHPHWSAYSDMRADAFSIVEDGNVYLYTVEEVKEEAEELQ